MRLETAWVGTCADSSPDTTPDTTAPVIVFLHEGLGSVSMWKDFPARLCVAAGCRGFVYSRAGYGRSTARPPDEHWQPDFMHRQAFDVLPGLLEQHHITKPWLFGHSDGGSIALLHASRFPVAGVIAVAPHILVEDISIESIIATRQAYLHGDLRARLARHHGDPDSAFWGWNEAWLNPAFRSWSIADELKKIRAPLLAVQGVDDEYGTLAQIRGIAQRVPQTQLLELPDCGHSPHRDQPRRLIEEVTQFIRNHPAGDS